MAGILTGYYIESYHMSGHTYVYMYIYIRMYKGWVMAKIPYVMIYHEINHHDNNYYHII